jgi:signal transduction histidine kinase
VIFVTYVVRAPNQCSLLCPAAASGSRQGAVVRVGVSVTQREAFVEGRREILRQASVALGGRSVTAWEVSARAELEPQASSDPAPTHHATKLDVDATLRRWNIAIVQGSRWVGCRAASEGSWVVAPVRTRPPAPPPEGHERRSPERLTLELAGLCLGLLDRRESAPGQAVSGAPRSDPFQDTGALPGIIAHELSNPLTAARAGLQLAMESVGRWTEVAAGRRLDLLDELGQVVEDIERSIGFLRAIKDRARGALARSERFDAVRVIRSCCTLESRVLKEKRIPLEFDSTLETVYLKGDPNALYDLLVNLIRNSADASAGRPAPIRVGLAQEAASLRLTVEDRGSGIRAQDLDRIFEPGFTTKEFGEGSGMGLVVVQSVVRNMFGGSIAVDSNIGVGTTVIVTLPIPPQRSIDVTGGPGAA